MRPYPTPADRAEADRFVAEVYDADPTVCRVWLANNRATLVRYASDAVMHKRIETEHRADTEAEIGRRAAMSEAA